MSKAALKVIRLCLFASLIFAGCSPTPPAALPETPTAASSSTPSSMPATATLASSNTPTLAPTFTLTAPVPTSTQVPATPTLTPQPRACASDAAPQTYYVHPGGSDQNSGLTNTVEGAFASLERGISALCAGDTLLVSDGEYRVRGLQVSNLKAAPERPTVIASLNPWGAKIILADDAEQYATIVKISNSAYLEFSGFEVLSNATGWGAGIDVDKGSHHVTVRGNSVRDAGCNGISSRESDYLIFESNLVRGNAKRSEWNCSGISIWHPIESDQEPGFHIVIRKNVVFENECNLPAKPLGQSLPTDGNGIIIDDFRNTQGGGQEGGYHAEVLVENNLSFNNGGRGIHVFLSDNVTVRSNTIFHNLRVLSRYNKATGDLSFYESTGSRAYNNLVVKNPKLSTLALHLFSSARMDMVLSHNFFIGEKSFADPTSLGVTDEENQYLRASEQAFPQFLNPTVDVIYDSLAAFRPYFDLSAASPARAAGSSQSAPVEDLDGAPRPQGVPVDLGCYQSKTP